MSFLPAGSVVYRLMFKKIIAGISIFSLFACLAFCDVMSLSEIDALIAQNDYSAALEQLSLYIQKYPEQFDKAQKRVSKIIKERRNFNLKALDLAQKMEISATEELTDEQSDALDSQKMDIIVALENAEKNPAQEAVDLTNDARRTIRLSYYINRSNMIVGQGTSLISGGTLGQSENYKKAVSKFEEGLSLKTKDSDIIFEGDKEILVEYPQKLNSRVEAQQNKVRSLNSLLLLQIEKCQEDYNSYKLALAEGSVQKCEAALQNLKKSFGTLAETRNSIYDCGNELISLEKTALELNPGLTDTSYITFSRWAVLGIEHNPDSGIVHAVDAFWNTRIEDLKSTLYAMIQNEYAQIYSGIKTDSAYFTEKTDLEPFVRSAGLAYSFAGQGQEVHSLYSKLKNCAASGYKKYDSSLAFIRRLSNSSLQNAFSLSQAVASKNLEVALLSLNENNLSEYAKSLLNADNFYRSQSQKISTEQNVQFVKEEKTVQAQFEVDLESGNPEEADGLQTPQVLSAHDRTTAGVQLKDESLDWTENIAFFENLLSASLEECKKQSGAVWSALAKAYSGEAENKLASLTLEASEAAALLNGVEENDGETKITKFYPTRAYEKCLALNSAIQKETGILRSYRTELNGGAEYAQTEKTYADGCQKIDSVITALNSLVADSNRIITSAKIKSNEALKSANEARQLYSQAQKYMNSAEYDLARETLSEADTVYKKSLQLEENDSLRKEFGSKVAALDEEITAKQNDWVITNVRTLITGAYNDYYAGSFETAKTSLVKAGEIWAKTQANENSEVTELLALVQEALESSGGKEIAYSDPLYKDMGAYLNNAKINYEKGAELFKSGKTEEGTALLTQSRDEVRKVQRVFPKNLEANNLNILINKILDPAAFESTVASKISQAKTAASSGRDVDLRNALNDLKDLQKVIPDNKEVAKTVKDFENQIANLAKSEQNRKNLERSAQLTRQAQNETNLTRKITLLDEALSLNRRNTQAQKLKDQALISNTKTTTVKNYLDDSDEVRYAQAERYYNDGLKDQALALITDLYGKNPQVAKVIKLKRRIENM